MTILLQTIFTTLDSFQFGSIKEIYIQHMTYLLLPSSRLALYIKESHLLKVLPIRAEEYVTLQQEGKSMIAVSYLKSVSFYPSDMLCNIDKASHLKPLSSVQFNKKIEGLTTNNKGTVYLSDKFGDIYSIGSTFEQKYMNSNLGIPTFLKNISAKNKNYLVVCDEDTRIKIYNEARMHQIISFWFLIRRVPLQLLQTSNDSLVLLVKKQSQINLQMQEEELQEFVELYQLDPDQLQESEFNGRLLYVSKEKEEVQECKYQAITYSQAGTLYLLKLFGQNITVITFNLKEGKYELHKTQTVAIQKGEWDYLYAQSLQTENKDALLIVFGKSYVYDETQEPLLEDRELIKETHFERVSLNKDQHMILLQL